MESDKTTTDKVAEPPKTDLDYYSRPENYEGSNLTNIKRFNFAKQKEEKSKIDGDKNKKEKKDGYELFKRYRHILVGYLDADVESDDGESSEEELEGEINSKIVELEDHSIITGDTSDEQANSDNRPDSQEKTPDLCTEQIKTPDTPADSGYRTGRDGSLSTTPVEMPSESSPEFGLKRGSFSTRSSVQLKQNKLSQELRTRAVSICLITCVSLSLRVSQYLMTTYI